MRKIVLAVLVAVAMATSVWAQSLTELEWQKRYYQEVLQRITTQVILLQKDYREVQDKLKEVEQKMAEVGATTKEGGK